MGMELLQASTADALTITGISRRAFNSDVEVGGKEKTGPPGLIRIHSTAAILIAGSETGDYRYRVWLQKG